MSALLPLALGVLSIPFSVSAASPGIFEDVGSTQVSAMMVCKPLLFLNMSFAHWFTALLGQ
jgi:hypothetical protein